MNELEPAVDRERVLRVAEEETAAVESRDLDKYMRLLTPDAVFMPQNVAAKSGDSLRAWLGDFLRGTEVHFTRFEHGDTTIRDDLACHTYFCSWTASPGSGGQPISLSFKGMHILRRISDGSWKIAVNIWNTDPAPSAVHA